MKFTTFYQPNGTAMAMWPDGGPMAAADTVCPDQKVIHTKCPACECRMKDKVSLCSMRAVDVVHGAAWQMGATGLSRPYVPLMGTY